MERFKSPIIKNPSIVPIIPLTSESHQYSTRIFRYLNASIISSTESTKIQYPIRKRTVTRVSSVLNIIIKPKIRLIIPLNKGSSEVNT